MVGVSQSFTVAWLIIKRSKCLGYSISGVECGRKDMDKAKLEEFRVRLRRECITLGVEKWERIILPLCPGEGIMVFFHRGQGKRDITDTRCQDVEIFMDSPVSWAKSGLCLRQ